MTSENWAGWIGTGATIIIGWDKISTFLQSFSEGLKNFLNSIPPMIILIMIIGLFWYLAKKS